MAEISVSKIRLTHGRLGEKINFGYGEGKVAGRDALLVLSERDEGGGELTMRIRPLDEGKMSQVGGAWALAFQAAL